MRFSRFRRYLAAKKYLYLLLFTVVLGSAYPLVADFYTKGEPREAIVAQAMMEDGEYILPRVYADEIAYKPPMFHWLEVLSTVFTGGEVTPLSARLPSAVALFALAAGLFIFVSQRRPISLALMATLIFLTALDPHRFGIMARVDMVLTAFMVWALFSLYAWDEKKGRRGIPWGAVLLMSGAFLTKGPVGTVLPLLIFFVYACLRRYPFWDTLLRLLGIGVLSAVLPGVWYFLAWQKGGDEFLGLVWNENIVRFFGLGDDTLFYPLGHEGGFYKPVIYFILGLFPWTFLPLFFRWKKASVAASFRCPLHLFAWTAALVTLVFYMIPMSKSSSYLLPMFPFVALGLAEGFFFLVKKEDPGVIRFAVLMSVLSGIVLVGMAALQAGFDPTPWAGSGAEVFAEGIRGDLGLSLSGELFILVGILTVVYQMMRRNYHKLAFATVFLAFIIHFNVDVPAMTHFKEVNSARPFARSVTEEIGSEPLYVISDLNGGYYNLYGLAFYADKRPLEFRTEKPSEGYLVVWEKDYESLKADYLGDYETEIVAKDRKSIQEGGVAQLVHFRRVH